MEMRNGLPVRPELNIRHLMAALEAANHGSISKACGAVNLSQASVTQAISKLESRLSTSLFKRSTHGVTPTAEGKQFLWRVARSRQHLAAFSRVADQRQNHQPRDFSKLVTSKQLRTLIAVTQCGSYSLAASRLGVAQPTAHRAVKTLETVFGQALFSRSPQGVDATWQAKYLSRNASLYFAEIAQGVDELRELQGLPGSEVTIGALPFSRTYLVPRAVTKLLEEYPDTAVSIVDGPYDEQLQGLLNGNIDLIVGALRQPTPVLDIQQELLFTDQLSIVVRKGHWAAKEKDIPASRLRELDWIAPRTNTPARIQFTKLFSDKGLNPPKHIIECSSLVAIRTLLMNSDRAALLPQHQVAVDVSVGLLEVCPMKVQGTDRAIGITTRLSWEPTRTQARLLVLLHQAAEARPESIR